ncbi:MULTISPECIES: serine/threonine-protein kinase [unclassified Streptomyces]|uniref:serine/threonine-protein kinase n=1 Tax=unclassified Streptomyces TaxID=2593676 RepID=UPI0028C47E84|nr:MULTISPECIES: serine/threonine-protein kinase [unclassified Streptomyces]WNO74117.1 serine/threonine-protein kinase [Streptomyces sp. AM8-1-1]
MNGRVIAGRYELSTIIGQGGMGQVWTAYDGRLDRRVAVKLLRPDHMAAATAAGEMRRRFVRECRVTAQVSHPGLVTVHDAGSDDDDLYLVMQYVEGADLADHLAEHEPYPWQWAVSVAAQLCAVLAAVHAVPIVHRDLKPRNVMVKPDGTVTVLDLGVASVIDTDTTRLTHTGSPIGSPAYMAPEQAMGGAVGPYTDLYALGVLLHELLSGNVPFAGSTALGVLHRHLYEAPLPIRRLRPEIPEPLEALVLRLLAKDPQHRPSGAQDVYEALAPLLPVRGMPAASAVRTPAGGPLDPTRPFLRPHAPWPDRVATPPPAMPTAPPAPRPDVAGAVDEVKRLLGEGSITRAVDILGGILPAAAAEHGEHSPVVRILRKQYATTLMDDGQYRRALPELRRLADDRAAEAGPADPQTLQFRYDAAQCLEQLGEPAAALAEYRAVLPFYESRQSASSDPARAFDVRHRIGNLLLAVGDHTAAQQQFQGLLYDTERAYGPYHQLPQELRRAISRQQKFFSR